MTVQHVFVIWIGLKMDVNGSVNTVIGVFWGQNTACFFSDFLVDLQMSPTNKM